MIMSPDRGGIFAMLRRLVRLGLGGPAGSGKQFVSWIHEYDFVRAVDYLIRDGRLTGPVNVCSPEPMPNREFMAELRKACGMPIGLPASKLMLEIGAFFMRTETELILKSRRVVPKRLLDSGFQFKFPSWADAARDLCRRYRVQEKWSNGVNSSGVME
jgi:NAD dependent epimerase/dehydratase family enzyme